MRVELRSENGLLQDRAGAGVRGADHGGGDGNGGGGDHQGGDGGLDADTAHGGAPWVVVEPIDIRCRYVGAMTPSDYLSVVESEIAGHIANSDASPVRLSAFTGKIGGQGDLPGSFRSRPGMSFCAARLRL